MYANSGLREHTFNLRISAQLRTHFQAFINPAEIFSEVGKKIFTKTLKKMFENEVHCFLTTQCFQLLNCIASHRIASYRIVLNRFYQHASVLVSYRAHVSRYKSDRLYHERFTPLLLMLQQSDTVKKMCVYCVVS